MGCCTSKPPGGRPSQPPKPIEVPPKTDPNDQTAPISPLSRSALFNKLVLPNGVEANAVLAEGFAVIAADTLSRDDCLGLKTDLKLTEKVFYQLAKPGVVFVSATSDVKAQFSCAIVSPSDQIRVGDKSVSISHVNRHRIYYSASTTRNTPIGAAVCHGQAVVGLHERPGCAISMQWICFALQRSGEVPKLFKSFFDRFKDEVREIGHLDRIYGLQEDWLVSFNPVNNDFIQHERIPQNAKMCFIDNGLLLCGGLENNKLTNKTLMFDCASEILVERGVLSTPRQRHCLCLLDGYVYCISGIDKTALKNCERYNVQLAEWEDIASITKARLDAGAVGIKDTVYVIGGFNEANVPEPGIALFHNEFWETKDFGLPAFTKPVMAAIDSDSVYICSNQLIRWNPSTKETTPLKEQDFSSARSVMLRQSLFLFLGRTVVEVQISKDPVTDTRHDNPIPVE